MSVTCPNCRERLVTETYGAIGGASCFYCDGVWLPTESLASALSLSPGAPNLTTLLSRASERGHTNSSLVCPTCKEATFIAIKAQGVELDICRQCGGIYFDKGEVEQVFPQLKEKMPNNTSVIGIAVASEVGGDILSLILISLFSGGC